MQGHRIDIVNSFKYLDFSWTSKLSLMPTVQRGLENAQRSLNKLRWLRSGRTMSKEVLRQWFFAYTFPHFAWLFPVFPFLPETQKEALIRKFRVPIRLIHRATFVDANHLFAYTNEDPLDSYVKRYISKRLNSLCSSDLGSSLFLEDIFHWDNFQKRESDGGGHFFSMKRVKRMKAKHRSLLLTCLDFVGWKERFYPSCIRSFVQLEALSHVTSPFFVTLPHHPCTRAVGFSLVLKQAPPIKGKRC